MKALKEVGLGRILLYGVYLLVTWGLFRLTIRGIPPLLEEMIIKPIVWGWPILGWRVLGKEKINLFSGVMFRAVLEGVGLGAGFVLVIVAANLVKSGAIVGQPILTGLSAQEIVTAGLATAIIEELVFAGFILMKLSKTLGESAGLMLTTIMFTLINLPIAMFVYRYQGMGLVGFAVIVMLTASARYWLMLRTKNLWSPVVAHWIYGIAIWALG